MRIVLLAGGQQTRWREGSVVQGAQGTGRVFARHPNKLLVPVAGLPLLQRTLEQLRRRGHEARIVATDPELLALAAPHPVPPAADVVDAVAALCAEGAPVLVLLADVFFSAAAIEQVLADGADPWRLYGKLGANPFTGKPWPEIYALRAQGEGLRAIVDAAASLPAGLARRKLWELYRGLRGDPVPPGLMADAQYLLQPPPDPRFGTIDDWTDDVDEPGDYAMLRKVLGREPAARWL